MYLKDDGEIESGDEPVEEPAPAAPADPEAEKALMESIEKGVQEKVDKFLKDIQENPVKNSPMYRHQEATIEKSVLETDPYLRSKRPFVKLSKDMELFIDFMKSMKKGDQVGMQKAQAERTKLMTAQQKALQEDNDTEGGFTVPEEFQAEVVRYMDEAAVIRGRARVFNMTRDILRLPSLDQSSSVFGGFSFNEVDEEGAATEDSPTFGRITLRAKKVVGLTYVSSELLEDSAVNIANFMVSLMGEALADLEDTRFLTGTGMGQPLGITIALGTNIVSRQTSSRIVYEDVFAMWKGTLSTFDKNAVWVTSKAGVEQLLLINAEATGGLMLWVPSLRDSIPGTLLGKPLLVTERVQALGTAGDIIYGDLSKYFIGDRGGVRVDSSIHNKFETDQTTLRMIKRYDGQPAIAKAFTKLRE